MIDSPVGKTAEFAVPGTLTLMVGGPADAIARCRPVLDCMGTDFFHCGELGAGAVDEAHQQPARDGARSKRPSEALVAGVKAGLTLDTMLSVMKTTMAWNNQMAMAMQKRPLVGDFQPGFMLKLAHKDCRLALQMVDSLGVSAKAGRAALASLEEGRDNGMDLLDVGALLKLREEEARVRVRLRSPAPGEPVAGKA